MPMTRVQVSSSQVTDNLYFVKGQKWAQVYAMVKWQGNKSNISHEKSMKIDKW